MLGAPPSTTSCPHFAGADICKSGAHLAPTVVMSNPLSHPCPRILPEQSSPHQELQSPIDLTDRFSTNKLPSLSVRAEPIDHAHDGHDGGISQFQTLDSRAGSGLVLEDCQPNARGAQNEKGHSAEHSHGALDHQEE